MPLPSNGFPTLPTDQTATAKIRSVYHYVQYALLLSRTLLEVLGCSYYRTLLEVLGGGGHSLLRRIQIAAEGSR